jgi:hypothetical protein
MTGPIADVAASYGDDNLSPKQTHTKRTMLIKNAGGQFSHNSVMRTDSDISERMVHNIPSIWQIKSGFRISLSLC